MTPYLLLMQACGLSQREAAELRGVRLDTVKSWCSGRNMAPAQAVEQLRALYLQIEFAADRHLDVYEKIEAVHGLPAVVELGYPADDHEARLLDLPTVSAWRAMAAIVIANVPSDFVLVPRGSTPATAAAADAHGK